MSEEHFMHNVDHKHHFYANNGAEIRNLAELRDALRTMDDATFKHHVNKERNDFQTWVGDIVGDADLARQIAKAGSGKRMAKIVAKRIARLEKRHGSAPLSADSGENKRSWLLFLEGLIFGLLIGIIVARLIF
jgi:hypothetical protein